MPPPASIPAPHTLPLHDALPTCSRPSAAPPRWTGRATGSPRSETSRAGATTCARSTTPTRPRAQTTRRGMSTARSGSSPAGGWGADRKSTRLNSRHTVISYAASCVHPRAAHSSPTRRSSDLLATVGSTATLDGASYRFAALGNISGGGYYVRAVDNSDETAGANDPTRDVDGSIWLVSRGRVGGRSEEHTSELQTHSDLLCRLLRPSPRRTLFPYTTLFRPARDRRQHRHAGRGELPVRRARKHLGRGLLRARGRQLRRDRGRKRPDAGCRRLDLARLPRAGGGQIGRAHV